MPSSAGLEFDTVFTYTGSAFSANLALEMQSPRGTAASVLTTTSDYLYLGDAEKFDMAVFDLATSGNLGALTWEFSNGSNWTTFTPSSGRLRYDVDETGAGSSYDFGLDGVEMFPTNQLSSWATLAVNSVNIYWIRVTAASVTTAPQIYRIQKRPYATYCSTQDVFNFLQLNNITGTTDFTTTTVPSKNTVEQYIQAAESKIDYTTRKSWRPTYVANEYHEFNLNGMHLDHADPYKILKLEIWNGGGWDNKRQGRKLDFFLVPDTGLIHYSRYFLLPARFQSYNAPIWRWGGGEFTMPIKVTYLTGRDLAIDVRGGGIVHEATKKMAAINVMRSADFGNLVVSGMDRVQASERIQGWQMEIEDAIESLWSFEIF